MLLMVPFMVQKRWCKECPVYRSQLWQAEVYFSFFTKSTFSWKGKILEPDIVWHNVL